ncbi:MAG: YgjP-like metallopeptidase domain-containing protein [Desulfobacterales bacterium]
MTPPRSDKQNTLEIGGLGVIRLKRSRRARYMNLTVKPFCGIGVTIPYGVSVKQVERFVVSKTNWVVNRLARVRQLEQQRLRASAVIEKTDPGEARQFLVRQLKALARQHGFTVGGVAVRRQKTRWGSCSAVNNISLNINLVHLPRPLMTYVILHELLHTRIKNHGPRFWSELDKLVGDARRLRADLNGYGYLLLQI